MIAFATDWYLGSNLTVEGDAANGILLFEYEVGDAGSQRAAVLVFIERAISIRHAVGHVNQKCASEIRVFFELFDVQSVLACPDLPIHMAKVIAGGVLSMLPEFHRLSEIRTAMHSGQESFDNMSSSEV